MEQRILETIKEYRMLSPGDCVAAGVSGGADSICLLDFLCRYQAQLEIRALICCHLHHGIRGEEADRDQLFVKNFCRERGIPFVSERRDIPALAKETGDSEEACGRKERYLFFQRALAALCGELELPLSQGKIATAHTLSDSQETFFLNLLRGTGLKGLCGVPPGQGQIIRPLSACTRSQIEEYCRSYQLEYVTDSTNESDLYLRNRVRHQLIPVLQQLSPAFDSASLRMMENLRSDAAALENAATAALENARTEGFSPLEPCYSREVLSRLDAGLGLRCCGLLIRQAGGEADYSKIHLVWEAVQKGGGVPVGAKRQILVTEKKVLLRSLVSPPAATARPVSVNGETVFGAKIFSAFFRKEKKYENLIKVRENDLKNLLDYDKIKGDLYLRTRQPGDHIHLAGKRTGKTLKKLFWEHQIPLPERDRLLILCDQEGVCWVEGFGCDQRVAAAESTRNCLRLSVKEESQERDTARK